MFSFLEKNKEPLYVREGERNDAVLNLFNVFQTEQEIFIKGNRRIEWEQYVLDISKLQGGFANRHQITFLKKVISDNFAHTKLYNARISSSPSRHSATSDTTAFLSGRIIVI